MKQLRQEQRLSRLTIAWRRFGWLRFLLLPVIMVASIRFWVGPAVYLVLRSYLAVGDTPSKLLILALASFAIYSFASSFAQTIRDAKAAHVAKRNLNSGYPIAQTNYEGAREWFAHPRKMRLLGLAFLAFYSLLPLVVAQELWGDMQTPNYRRAKGKLVVEGPTDQLKSLLQKMERRGIFTPMGGD